LPNFLTLVQIVSSRRPDTTKFCFIANPRIEAFREPEPPHS
jgi:hypothetical protein